MEIVVEISNFFGFKLLQQMQLQICIYLVSKNYWVILQWCKLYNTTADNLIIINGMHKILLNNCSFSFGRMITKCGRNTKRRSGSNMVEPKFGLKSFHLGSSTFISKRLCFVVHKLFLQLSTNLCQTWKSISRQYGGWPKVVSAFATGLL